MNYPYLHILISHIPIVALLVLTLLSIISYKLKNRQMEIVSYVLALFGFALTFPLYYYGSLTGESAQKFPAVTEDRIQAHEGISYTLLKLIIIASVVTLISLYLKFKNKQNLSLHRITLLIYVATSALLIQTALTGYKIRHTESRISVFKSLEE